MEENLPAKDGHPYHAASNWYSTLWSLSRFPLVKLALLYCMSQVCRLASSQTAQSVAVCSHCSPWSDRSPEDGFQGRSAIH